MEVKTRLRAKTPLLLKGKSYLYSGLDNDGDMMEVAECNFRHHVCGDTEYAGWYIISSSVGKAMNSWKLYKYFCQGFNNVLLESDRFTSNG